MNQIETVSGNSEGGKRYAVIPIADLTDLLLLTCSSKLKHPAHNRFDTQKSKGNQCVSSMCCGYGVWEMLPVAISPVETNGRIPSLPLIRARPLVHKPSIYYSSKMKWCTLLYDTGVQIPFLWCTVRHFLVSFQYF